jgi:hypothetical protein
LDIARQLHSVYKLFSETDSKEIRRTVYRSRLLEEFVLCAHFQSLIKEKFSFASVFKQIISYIYKNYVITLDLIVERMGPSYSCQPNFDKLKTLLSKRKAYFEISSTFNSEKRFKLLAANFESVGAILENGSQIKNKTCKISPLLVQVLNLINTGKSATEKEGELAKFFEMIEIDYRTLCCTEPVSNLKKTFETSIFGGHTRQSSMTPSSRKNIGDKSTDKSSMKKRDKTEEKRVTFNLEVNQSVHVTSTYLLPPLHPKYKYTVVLDLDETLIYYVDKKKRDTQFLLRPYVREFIGYFGKIFELVVFTASIKEVGQSYQVR